MTEAGWGQAAESEGGELNVYDMGYEKAKSLSYFKIYMINAEGNHKEEWTLINPFIKSMNFGDLSYDSEDLVDFQMIVANDGFNLEKL